MIETSRLIIKPLTYPQLLKYIDNDQSLENELSLFACRREISPELKEALEKTIIPCVADPSRNYLYSTLWTMIEKVQNKMVGDLCFTGEPDTMGEIQIGYGTYEKFRNMGFMTEAVEGLIKWTRKQPEIKSILATTDKKNIASYSVLIKNNFKKVATKDALFYWKLKLTEL